MSCSQCGYAITAQEKRKPSGRKYTYYHCTGGGKAHCRRKVYIREEKFEAWFTDALAQIQIPEHIAQWTQDALIETQQNEQAHHEKQRKLMEGRYRTIQQKINRTYEDKLEGRIDLDFWKTQNNRLNKELNDLEAQMTSLASEPEPYVEKGLRFVNLAKQAPVLFKSMTKDEKREMVSLVLSNLQIENGSLRYDFRKPFSLFLGVTTLEKWRGRRDSNPRPSA
ncbi:MAG: zinc ribbon domain-containing protein [Bdellovibrionaceae bacterium]|nr:zinc ribbon domain-containing protein [Pseudobdellovibrionaceae bacterium]